MRAYLDEVSSPMGQIDFATDEEGSFLGLRFREGRRSVSLEKGLERAGFDLVARNAWTFMRTTGAREQLVEYLAGERRSFDVPVARKGSDLEEAEFTIPGQIVADIAVRGEPMRAADGSTSITIEALTVAES